MLIYNPAFDLYHCVYRMLQLITNIDSLEIEVERIRIWDFYLLFPTEIKDIHFPRNAVKLKKHFDENANPYDNIGSNNRSIFYKMKDFQLAALHFLASYSFIDSELLEEGKVKSTGKNLPDELNANIYEANIQAKELIELLTKYLIDVPLYGDKGLKYRTNLIDYKYDPT